VSVALIQRTPKTLRQKLSRRLHTTPPVTPSGELDETRVVFGFGPFALLRENMTSSTQVYNVSQCRHRRTERRPQVTYRKFGQIWTRDFRDMRADIQTSTGRQTDIQYITHADRSTLHPYQGRSNETINV